MEHICRAYCKVYGCTLTLTTYSAYPDTSGTYDIRTLAQLINGKNKKEKKMSVVAKLKSLTLTKGERLLRKYDLVSDCGDLTDEGREVLDSILLTEYKDKLIERVTELDKEEKAEKKK